MADIRIRVGASLDGSPAATFRSLADMARKARAQVSDELAKTGEPLAKSVKTNAAKAERAMTELRAKLSGQDLMAPGTRAIKQFGDDAAKRFEETKRRFKELSGEVVKGAREIEKAEKQANKTAAITTRKEARDSERSSRVFRRDAGRVGWNIARGALSGATRIAGDLASGAGVDLDFASQVSKNVGLESRATALSNAGYMSDPEHAGTANGTRQDPRALIAQAREVGDAVAMDPTKAIEGLEAFVGKTGDLALGRDILKDMAVLSKASGASMEDMVDAAGDVANGLGDIPNKAEAIRSVMVSVAGQGKLGAVEIKDMASQMAKLAASAGQFEGDVSKNIVFLGALAQSARAHGGAASATQAATAVAGFVNTLKTPARSEAFKAATGKSVYNAQGMIRDPQELIMEALRAKGMDPTGFKKIFANVQGARAVEGLATTYRQHGGGAEGEAAVAAELKRLTSAAAGQAEIQGSLSRAMMTTESRVQLFNNSISRTTESLQASLGPALESLVPSIVAAGNAMAGIVAWWTGKADADKNKDDADAFNKAAGTTRTLNAALAGADDDIAGGKVMHVAPGAMKASAENEAAIKRAMDDAQAEADTKKEKLGMAVAQSFGPDGTPVAPGVREDADGAQSRADSYKAEYDKLHTINERVAYLLENHVLRVVVTNPAAVAPPKVDNGPRGGRADVSQ